jgi:hypothetical protein
MVKSKYANNKEALGNISYLPPVLRAETYIDLAQYPKTVEEAKKAYFFVDLYSNPHPWNPGPCLCPE